MSEHQEYGPESGGGACSTCDQEWPCRDALLDALSAAQAEVETLRGQLATARQEIREVQNDLFNVGEEVNMDADELRSKAFDRYQNSVDRYGDMDVVLAGQPAAPKGDA